MLSRDSAALRRLHSFSGSAVLKPDLEKPLTGRPARAGRTAPSAAPRHAGIALGVLAFAGAAWLGTANWAGFANPEPPAAPSAPDAQTTGTVPAEAAPGDPARPNEISRTQTDGGAMVIKVKPPSGSDGGSNAGGDLPDGIDGNGSIIVRDPAQLNQTAALAHVPRPELLEKDGERRLPRRAEDGTRPFDAYARSWSGAAGPRIAIIITGLGLSQTGTQSAIQKLPGEVSLAFASEGNSIDRWMQAARRDGHEILLQVPMEPFDYPAVSPGRMTLEAAASADANSERLHWALGRTTNYVGVMNHMGARFTAEDAAMQPVMAELSARGLGFLDDGSSARSRARANAESAGVPFAQADLTIDADREAGAILAKLNELEQIARAQGSAIGIGAAFNETVGAVTQWMNAARTRGIEFVPVTAVSLDPERR